MANETPSYLYKLILPSEVNELLPIPLHPVLPLSDHDRGDRFIHLATAKQVKSLIKNNDRFKDKEEVIVLRIPYAAIQPRIKWQNGAGTVDTPVGAEGSYGHIHKEGSDTEPKLRKQEVEGIFFLRKSGGEWVDQDFERLWLIY